jgi:hypothetical protein
MVPEFKKEIEREIAHVSFIDIVGYSTLSINGVVSPRAMESQGEAS